jgi:hypothetical protein
MPKRSVLLPIVLILIVSTSVLTAQTRTGSPPTGPLLGRGHIWLKAGQNAFGGAATSEWGVDHEDYLAIEGYSAARAGAWYAGGELGRTASADTVNDDGDTIRDLGFWWIELNAKRVFGLKHGFTVDAGFGGAMFYVEGDEVSVVDGTTTDPLADIGFGLQGFADFTWRTRNLLLGLDAKYQWAVDLVSIDYTNLGLGVHVGFCF